MGRTEEIGDSVEYLLINVHPNMFNIFICCTSNRSESASVSPRKFTSVSIILNELYFRVVKVFRLSKIRM